MSEGEVRARRAGRAGGVAGHGEADGDAVGAAGVVGVRVGVHRTVFRKQHARELRDAGADVAGARRVGAVGEGGDLVEEGGDDGHWHEKATSETFVPETLLRMIFCYAI